MLQTVRMFGFHIFSVSTSRCHCPKDGQRVSIEIAGKACCCRSVRSVSPDHRSRKTARKVRHGDHTCKRNARLSKGVGKRKTEQRRQVTVKTWCNDLQVSSPSCLELTMLIIRDD